MKKFRYLLLIVVTVVFVYLAWKNYDDVVNVIYTIPTGNIMLLISAFIAQAVSYYFLTNAHRFSLQAVNIYRKNRELLPLICASLTINTTAPTSGASGALLFANDAKKRGESGLSAATGILFLIVGYYIGLSAVLTFSLFYLRSKGELGITEIIFTAILVIAGAFFSFLIFTAKQRPELVRRSLTRMNRVYYYIRRPFWRKLKYSDKWVIDTTAELNKASVEIHKNPKKIAETVSMHLLVHVFNLLCLYLIFRAFGVTPKLGVLISGYAIGELFKTVSPSPEGVGVTEGSMALVYTSFGIPAVLAVSISLIYRIMNFWIPFSIGFFILQKELGGRKKPIEKN